MRKPLPEAAKRAGGPHQGYTPPNVHWLIYLACADGESIDAATLEALRTTQDLDDMYDLIELKQVHASWMVAAQANAELEAEKRRRLEEMRAKRRGK
jgi:hypothetical protein